MDYGIKDKEQSRKEGKDMVDSELELERIANARRSTQIDADQANVKLKNEREELDRRVNLDALQTLMERNKNEKK